MDAVRHFIALLMLCMVPPSILFWFSIHPFIRFWRSLGPKVTLWIHYPGALAMAGLIYLFGRPLLAVEFGTNIWLIAIAVPILGLSAYLRRQFSKQLRLRTLTGLPELAPDQHRIPLLKDGIYARMRHPRYVQFQLAVMAYALFCNYLAIYVLVVLVAITFRLLVVLEERELRDRYGPEYDAYCAQVPRFVPRLGPRQMDPRLSA